MTSLALHYSSTTAPPSTADLYSMQHYSRFVGSVHMQPALPSPAVDFAAAGLFDDDEPLPLWATAAEADAGAYTDSLDSTSTGNTTPDSPSISPFHLPNNSNQLSSSSSASTCPSPVPSSPSSTALVPTATAPSKRKRQRLTGATKEERLALAVLRHREIDGARRQREKEVVQRLERLTTSQSGEEKSDEKQSATVDGEDSAAGKRSRRNKREKVDVLEESAEMIEQLRAMVKRMEDANSDKDAQINKLRTHLYGIAQAREDFDEVAVMVSRQGPGQPVGGTASHPLALLPAAASNALSLYDNRQTLLSSSLVSSGPCLLLVQQGTGALLEANERFVSLSGYALSALLFTVLRPPLPGMHVRVCPLMLKHSKARGSPTDHTYISQYSSSRQAIIDLCAGKERRVDLLWRMYMADGRLYEVQYAAFVTRQGVMVWLCNLEDAMLVEAWDETATVGSTGEPLVLCDETTIELMKQQAGPSRWRYEGEVDESGEAKVMAE